jgi:guanylate kinase
MMDGRGVQRGDFFRPMGSVNLAGATGSGGPPARPSLLVVVSAPSGAGKTSLCNQVAGQLLDLVHSVSHTTRPPRPAEVDGKDYHFTDAATFRGMVERGEFAEWAEVHGHLYGTSRAVLAGHFSAGRDVLLDIDTQGAATLRTSYPDGVFVFIVPPSWAVLEERLRLRHSDDEAAIRRRLKVARDEVRHYGEYTYVLINDEFTRAAERLTAIILAERQRTFRVALDFLTRC